MFSLPRPVTAQRWRPPPRRAPLPRDRARRLARPRQRVDDPRIGFAEIKRVSGAECLHSLQPSKIRVDLQLSHGFPQSSSPGIAAHCALIYESLTILSVQNIPLPTRSSINEPQPPAKYAIPSTMCARARSVGRFRCRQQTSSCVPPLSEGHEPIDPSLSSIVPSNIK